MNKISSLIILAVGFISLMIVRTGIAECSMGMVGCQAMTYFPDDDGNCCGGTSNEAGAPSCPPYDTFGPSYEDSCGILRVRDKGFNCYTHQGGCGHGAAVPCDS